jgi:hypothetical protein
VSPGCRLRGAGRSAPAQWASPAYGHGARPGGGMLGRVRACLILAQFTFGLQPELDVPADGAVPLGTC